MRHTGTIELDGETDKTFKVQDPKLCIEHPSTASLNPWSIRCHREQLAKMRNSNQGNGVHKFILLENLASHFRMPCILDLKMGTRQHGDDAGEEKRRTQEQKCRKTTSHSLGLRLCGMQVYQSDTGHYICHNKYFGRKLSAEGVQDILLEFLNNGSRIRTALIDVILEKLHKLYEVLSKQNTFRFYSSSLLIMYDGLEVENESSPAHRGQGGQCRQQQQQQQQRADTPQQQQQRLAGDEASSAGQNSHHSNGASMPMDTTTTHTAATHDQTQLDEESSWKESSPQYEQQQEPLLHTQRRIVDVKMIDFAHTTHEGFRDDRTLHSGPDKGYLFGLENLIRMFQKLKDSVCT